MDLEAATNEISALPPELGALTKRHLQLDITGGSHLGSANLPSARCDSTAEHHWIKIQAANVSSAELQVQKSEARHQKITQEKKSNKVSSFAHRVALLAYAQIVELHMHKVALLLDKVV